MFHSFFVRMYVISLFSSAKCQTVAVPACIECIHAFASAVPENGEGRVVLLLCVLCHVML